MRVIKDYHNTRIVEGIEKISLFDTNPRFPIKTQKFGLYNFTFLITDGISLYKFAFSEFVSNRFYGITQDPETYEYMIVLEYEEDENLLFLMGTHKLDTVHQDFQPGNILSSNFKTSI
ncbi:hypothetical protein Glove_87g27 [Diversispora epigaea]|uniref:Uncharacterized protein n=1 Tax=Diversispora epigaea TaxID=1348612 RepID=A0A397JA20_9GLOM|nr:hypothetical protein Glove_87g27 [Diversispora epigaea]